MRIIGKAAGRVTWKRVRWLARTNLQSWAIQGVLYGALTLAGVGSLAAIVGAKAAAWAVFAGQCVKAARA